MNTNHTSKSPTSPLTLVIDQGTHATRAVAVDRTGIIKHSAFSSISLKSIGHGIIEQDPDEIINSVHTAVDEILSDKTIQRIGISCAGIATQRSSVAAWDIETGKPLAPVISWQDFRNADMVNQLKDKSINIKRTTGLMLSPHYGATKFRWYLDNVPDVQKAEKEKRLAMGPLVSFILFHILKGKPFQTDHANALRTQLLNIDSLKWDPLLLNLFNIPLHTLPDCKPVVHSFGRLNAADIPVTAVNGDQNAAVYSMGRPKHNRAIINIGTGAFILLPTGNKRVPDSVLLSGLTSSGLKKNEYAIEGTVNGAGAALEWAAENWSVKNIKDRLPDWMRTHKDVPVFINTIGGLGSPWWKPGPKATIIGDGNMEQRIVAVAESILFMIYANLQRITDTGLPVKDIFVTGGLSRNDQLCCRLADLTQLPVIRPAETEATARGIAWLASGCPEDWKKPGPEKTFHPQPNPSLADRCDMFLNSVI